MRQLFALSSPQSGGGGDIFSTILMFGMIISIFYFMIIRPQSKNKKREKSFYLQ